MEQRIREFVGDGQIALRQLICLQGHCRQMQITRLIVFYYRSMLLL